MTSREQLKLFGFRKLREIATRPWGRMPPEHLEVEAKCPLGNPCYRRLWKFTRQSIVSLALSKFLGHVLATCFPPHYNYGN